LTRIRSTIGAIFGVIRRVKYWGIIAGKVSKPVVVGAASQQWILTGEQSSLLTHIATMVWSERSGAAAGYTGYGHVEAAVLELERVASATNRRCAN
jgi:predicted anti-sigma-YlaC factor YlaD